MMLATAVLNQQGAAAGGFNPQTSITWHSLFWAEGSDFVSQGYANTDSVTTWPNESGESDATTNTVAPTYVTSGINGEPSVRFDGATNLGLATAAFSVAPSYTSGVSIVVVASVVSGVVTRKLVDGFGGARNAIYAQGGTIYRIFGGTTERAGGIVTAGPHLMVAQFFTGNDLLIVDGTTVINADSGSATLTGIKIGRDVSNTSQGWDGDVALVGIYEGDITADGNWSAFKSWVTSHYGITIV